MESMGVTRGCGCKEVYRFPHITYPYPTLLVYICSFFAAASLLFVHFLIFFNNYTLYNNYYLFHG